MLFPDFFDHKLDELATEIAKYDTPPTSPLPCDRWVARSSLQKAIRRGEVDLAQRSAANLYAHDRRAIWRHLGIIALEDVGVARIDILSKLVAAQRDSKWRKEVGGDWPVIAELIRQMAAGPHCQAVCDLLLRSLNDPALEPRRAEALEFEQVAAAAAVQDVRSPLLNRGIAALAIGGCLASGQRLNDACAAFELLADTATSLPAIDTSRGAWKLTRNPMALLLPLVLERWEVADNHELRDDPMPAEQAILGVPSYALDQFTRIGNQISRAYLRQDEKLRQLFDEAGVSRAAQARALGDVLFLIEGGLVSDRPVWVEAEYLRQPCRWLPAVATLGNHLPPIRQHCQAKASQIARMRLRLYHPSAPVGCV